jgi:hypothetical protein
MTKGFFVYTFFNTFQVKLYPFLRTILNKKVIVLNSFMP